ncbi:inositol monophosphatase family protein [Thalassococcus lentus]|uniref:Inositol monophosphatase n=1 Tax=Thalassococcus lentus TaxID=1210524 RepID=A0ABT4XMW5_9RHOB|nr:inositol monophosphatase [Thalassococcus lentus]MDA7423274.1 inositol monophosphatase [Thalassococcus lentus]
MSDSLPMTITALTKAQRAQLMTLVRRTARAEIMPRFRNLGSHQIDTKTGPQDVVTEADRAAEAMLTRGILQMFPHALIIGEENASENPKIKDKIADAELCFTIDPIDGTWNYAAGLTTFGVMISMLRFGKPVFGLLYDPVMNDFIIADSDSPSELVLPRRIRRPVATSAGGPLETLVGSVPVYMVPEEHRAATAATLNRLARLSSIRCACHEMRLLAQGQIDFILSAKLTPWDHPAGALIVQQAGGHVAMLDGSEYNASKSEGYLLCAANAETWGRVRDLYDYLIDTPAAEETAEDAQA